MVDIQKMMDLLKKEPTLIRFLTTMVTLNILKVKELEKALLKAIEEIKELQNI